MVRPLFNSAALGIVLLSLSGGCSQQATAGSSRPNSAHTKDVEQSALGQLITSEVEREMQKHQLASVAISVLEPKSTLYEGAFGEANREDHVLASLATPYRWGSNSKLFVMLGILQLVERGQLNLDTPLVHYLPQFHLRPPSPHHPESATWQLTDITLRSMLTHHSGIPNDYFQEFLSERPFPLAEFPARIAEMRAHYPVGLIHSYSNLAYTLLGLVIETVSGRPFADYMRDEIMRPLGMGQASFVFDDRLKQTVARSYDWDGTLLPRYQISMLPAGALLASPHEMGKFAQAMLSHGATPHGALVSRSLFDTSLRRQNADVVLDFDQKQGLAWFIDRRAVERFGHTVEHGGSVASHHSAFLLSYDAQLAVVVVTNSEQGARSVQFLAEQALEHALHVTRGKTPYKPHTRRRVPRGSLSHDQMTPWAGHYATPFGPVQLEERSGHLGAELLGQDLRLKPLQDGTLGVWIHKWSLFDLRPEPIKSIQLSLMEVGPRTVIVAETRGSRQLLAVKYESAAADPVWTPRLGVYRPQSNAFARELIPGIVISRGPDGSLSAAVIGRGPDDTPVGGSPLYPLDDRSAVGVGLGRNRAVEFRFDDHDRLNVSGLWFEKNIPNQAQ